MTHPDAGGYDQYMAEVKKLLWRRYGILPIDIGADRIKSGFDAGVDPATLVGNTGAEFELVEMPGGK